MHPYEDAKQAARERLRAAEAALADYAQHLEPDRERLKQLAHAASHAQQELLDLLARLCPEPE